MKETPAGRFLYHYTSFDTLQRILQSHVLRASDLRFMNDRTEYQHTIDLLVDHVKALKAGGSTYGFEEDCLTNVVERARNLYDGAFVFCLSECDNQLSQWRGYANGGGVAIGFNAGQLQACVAKAGARIVQCVYDTHEQERSIATFISDIRRFVAKQTNCDVPAAVKRCWWGPNESRFGGMAENFMRLATMFKHSKFDEEREWRVVALVKDRSMIKVRVPRDDVPVPFIDVCIAMPDVDQGVGPKKCIPIAEIVTGPSADAKALEIGTRAMFDAEGMVAPSIRPCGIPFRMSLR